MNETIILFILGLILFGFLLFIPLNRLIQLTLIVIPINYTFKLALGSISIVDIIVIAAFFKAIPEIIKKRIFLVDILLLTFTFIVLITIPFSIDKASSLSFFKTTLLGLLMFEVTSKALKKSDTKLIISGLKKGLIIEIIVILFLLVIYRCPGINVENFHVSDLYLHYLNSIKDIDVTGLFGTFSQHNIFSGFLVLILPFLMFEGVNRNRILLVIDLIILVLTFSRSGWVGFLVILIFYIFNNSLIKKKIKQLILVVCVLLPFYSYIMNRATNYTVDFGGNTVIDRLVIWKTALHLIPQTLLIGAGRQGFFYLSGYDFFAHAHNIILELIISYGLPGMLSFIIMYFYTIRANMMRLKDIKLDYLDKIFLNATKIALLGFLAHEMFDIAFLNNEVNILFWAILGTNWLILRASKKEFNGNEVTLCDNRSTLC